MSLYVPLVTVVALESTDEPSVPLEDKGLERLSGRLSGTPGQGIPVSVSSSVEFSAFFLARKASILCLLRLFLRELEWALFGGETEDSVFQNSQDSNCTHDQA